MANDTHTPPRAAKRKRTSSREPLSLFPETLRTCSKCRQAKPRDQFPRNRRVKDGLASNCRTCLAANTKDWRRTNPERAKELIGAWQRANPERVKELARAWQKANPERVKELARAWQKANPERVKELYLKRTYGLTHEQVAAKATAQNHKCAICADRLRAGRATAIDHCHATNTVRDILCAHCNKALGFAKDSPELLRAMANYIERHRLLADSAPCDNGAGENAHAKEQTANGSTHTINVQAHATQDAAQISNETDTRRSEEITP